MLNRIYITISENPNCEAIEGRVFQERSAALPVVEVLRQRGGEEVWCRITGMDEELKPVPAIARKVDDSGDGTCYLVTGGHWGLRLRTLDDEAPWTLDDSRQWGESFLLLPADGADLRFEKAG